VLAYVYYIVNFFLLVLILIFSALAKRSAGKSASDITYFTSSGTLDVNSINQRWNIASTELIFAGGGLELMTDASVVHWPSRRTIVYVVAPGRQWLSRALSVSCELSELSQWISGSSLRSGFSTAN